MTAKPDDDALSWAGDNDPTLAAGETPARPEPADGWSTPGPQPGTQPGPQPGTQPGTQPGPQSGTQPGTQPGPQSGTQPRTRPGTTPDGFHEDARDGAAASEPHAAQVASAGASATLVGLGILAGIYLLYTIGWYIGVTRLVTSLFDPVSLFMFSLGSWLAVAAPLMWFGVAYGLTTDRPRARLFWLLLGVVLLAPVPFIFGSGAAL
jgi:hypothetical protein